MKKNTEKNLSTQESMSEVFKDIEDTRKMNRTTVKMSIVALLISIGAIIIRLLAR